MKAVGHYQIQSPVVSGAVETFTARDPKTDATVLVHLLPPGPAESPEKKFLEFAPGCPGKILDAGLDGESQRAFVVTDYPKDRKALLLWIKSLSSVTPKAAAPVKPAVPPPATPPASDGATRMFDPSAMFGGAPPAAAPPEIAKPPASDGATRMFDPAAIFGGAPPAASPAEAGATKMFDPSAMFGGTPAPASGPPAPEARKTPAPAAGAKRITDPFADLKGAIERASSSVPRPSTGAPAKPSGEFTQRFELPQQFRNAPLRVDRTKEAEPKPGVHRDHPEGDKGIFTLMMEAFGDRVDAKDANSPAQPGAANASGSDGATRMFDPSALFGGGGAPPAEPKPAESTPPAGYPPTMRLPALKDEKDEDDKSSR